MAKKRKADLDTIIGELENDEAVAKAIAKHDDARAAHKGKTRVAKDYSTLIEAVRDYLQHHEKYTNKTELPDEMARDQAHQFIVGYGRRLLNDDHATEEEAIKRVLRDTKRGKLGDVFDAYKSNRRSQDEQAWERGVLHKHVDPLDYDHLSGLAGEYVDRHGHLLSDKERADVKTLTGQQLAYKAVELLQRHRAAKSAYKSEVGR